MVYRIAWSIFVAIISELFLNGDARRKGGEGGKGGGGRERKREREREREASLYKYLACILNNGKSQKLILCHLKCKVSLLLSYCVYTL